jgi:Domain of unknown function (DUF4304)
MDSFLVSTIDEFLKPIGFKKRTNEWSRSEKFVWQSIALTRHYNSSKYSIEIGVFLKAVDESKTQPKERFSHIRISPYFLLPETGHEFQLTVLDSCSSLLQDQRKTQLFDFLTKAVDHFFLRCLDEESITQAWSSSYLKEHALVHVDLLNKLNLSWK